MHLKKTIWHKTKGGSIWRKKLLKLSFSDCLSLFACNQAIHTDRSKNRKEQPGK